MFHKLLILKGQIKMWEEAMLSLRCVNTYTSLTHCQAALNKTIMGVCTYLSSSACTGGVPAVGSELGDSRSQPPGRTIKVRQIKQFRHETHPPKRLLKFMRCRFSLAFSGKAGPEDDAFLKTAVDGCV